MKYLNWKDIDIRELNDKIKRKYGRVDKRNENYLKDSKCLIEIITILRILLNLLYFINISLFIYQQYSKYDLQKHKLCILLLLFSHLFQLHIYFHL